MRFIQIIDFLELDHGKDNKTSEVILVFKVQFMRLRPFMRI